MIPARIKRIALCCQGWILAAILSVTLLGWTSDLERPETTGLALLCALYRANEEV